MAVKLIKRGMDTDAIERRFLHERQILASLNHPNIATLLDGGTTEDDRPYFIMEYIDGLPIDAWCDGQKLPIAERLRLFLAVCAAVGHAHDNRVVHRDLKPANILVTKLGVPKLLDFGIGKLLDAERGLHTRDATAPVRVMTPEYASPEQMRGGEVTAATDVYALGLLLYQLLAGRNPRAARGRTDAETERAVCEEIPAGPSAVVDEAAGRERALTRDALRRRLAGDLDTIVLKALQKDPARRYASVSALAGDVGRHLEGLPILARPDSLARRVARRVRRAHAAAPVAALALLLVLALVLLAGYLPGARVGEAPGPIGSIAVLPVAVDGGDGDDLEFLAEGITENVIRRLSRLSRLRVIARDSVYRYAGAGVDPREAGRQLGVEAVLIATVAPRGDVLALAVELVGVRDGRRLWGEQYTRPAADVQFVQAELAQQIARALRVRVSSHEQGQVARLQSVSADAYQRYLRGRFFANRRTPADLRRSVGYFSQAIEQEPSFALAYAGLADAWSLLTDYHALPARETYPLAKDAVTKALALDDELAEAHASLGYIRLFYEWDWPGAEAAYQRALELDPGYATAHQWYAEFLSAMGRHGEAMAEIDRAVAADPLSLIVNAVRANLLYLARQYDRAIEVCQEVNAPDPNFPEIYEYLKRSSDQKGLYADSVAARQTRRRLLGLDAALTPALRAAAGTADAHTYWRSRLAQELAEGQTEGQQAFEMAEILARAGDSVRALDWLEQACRDDDFMIMNIRVAPNLDPLRGHPRFEALLARSCRIAGAP